MKYFIYTIAMAYLGCATSPGNVAAFDRQFTNPDSIHIRGSMGEHAKNLKSLLDAGDLKAFYGSAKNVLSELNKMRRDGTMTREEACDMMWSLYLIGGAPLYESPDYTSDQLWPYQDERNNDIAAKSRVISALSAMDTKQVSRTLGIHEKQLKQLNAAYAANIIKKLKSLHIPDFEKKRPALVDEILYSDPASPDRNIIGTTPDDYAGLRRMGNLTYFSMRNHMYHSYVSNVMEKRLIAMIIRYFPTQSGEVMKYIRKAGYGENEILGLIDRTAGYTAATAYLYEGKAGAEHRKKLEQKIREELPENEAPPQ